MILDYPDEPSVISRVFIRRCQDSLHQRRCGSRGQRDETRNREHRDPLEAGKAREQSLPRAFGEHSSVDSMTQSGQTHVELLNSITVRLFICIVLNHQVCGSLLQQQQETNTDEFPGAFRPCSFFYILAFFSFYFNSLITCSSPQQPTRSERGCPESLFSLYIQGPPWFLECSWCQVSICRMNACQMYGNARVDFLCFSENKL